MTPPTLRDEILAQEITRAQAALIESSGDAQHRDTEANAMAAAIAARGSQPKLRGKGRWQAAGRGTAADVRRLREQATTSREAAQIYAEIIEALNALRAKA